MNTLTDDMFDNLWTNLVRRSAEDSTSPLTRDERIFYSINLLRGSIPRSGFLGYFESCTQRNVKDAIEGLTEIHLNEVASILRTALNEVIGGQTLTDELTPLEIVSPLLDEEEYMEECDRIADRLNPLEIQLIDLDASIYHALCRFAYQRIITTT